MKYYVYFDAYGHACQAVSEKELAEALDKNDVIAVKSVDFFENSFVSDKKSETELNAIEKQLTDAGFDAIILSKVISSENKISVIKALRNFDDSFNNFRKSS